MAPATITLSSGQLALAKSVTIYDGSGQGPVTVSGSVSNPSRVFQIDSGVKATLSGLTITGGSASTGFGGGLYSDDGTLNMTDCTISGNSANGEGGGLLQWRPLQRQYGDPDRLHDQRQYFQGSRRRRRVQ